MSSSTVEEVDLKSIISAKDYQAIQRVFPDGPKGKFIKARHGVTHYLLQEPANAGGSNDRKVVLMAHGIGTNLGVYEELSQALLSKGYTVLRYEFFNHGFSVSTDINIKMNDTVMMAQVEDLLQHVLNKDEELYAFVGHSTGGIVGVLAAQRLKATKRLALVSPCLWATKDLAAKMADRAPSVLHFLIKLKGPLARKAVKDSYIGNTHIAFAKNNDGEYIYPEAYKKALDGNYVLFENHPYIVNAIESVNGYFLNESLLKGWRDALKDVSNSEPDVETRLIFGTRDVVVNYDSPHLKELEELDHVQVIPIEGQGHESLYENTAPIADAMIEFFE